MKLSTNPSRFLAVMLSIVFVLFFGNAFSIFAKIVLDYDVMMGLVPLFSFNAEANIPTLFSSILMLIASALTFTISQSYRSSGGPFLPWLGLTLIFLFLAIDEFASLHERLTLVMRETLNTSGLFFYAWVIPYGLALLLFLSLYVRFLLKLPRKIMFLFVLSGAVFVSGAIGFELLGGRHEELHGTNNFLYSIYFTLEELLEMVGLILYIYALQTFIVLRFGKLSIQLKEDSLNQIGDTRSS